MWSLEILTEMEESEIIRETVILTFSFNNSSKMAGGAVIHRGNVWLELRYTSELSQKEGSFRSERWGNSWSNLQQISWAVVLCIQEGLTLEKSSNCPLAGIGREAAQVRVEWCKWEVWFGILFVITDVEQVPGIWEGRKYGTDLYKSQRVVQYNCRVEVRD